METFFNITQVIERQRLGYSVRKQVDIVYSKLKCTDEDLVYFYDLNEETTCPVFVSKFCDNKNFAHIVAVANEDGRVTLRNTNSLKKDKVITSFSAHNNAIFDIAWGHFDMQLITASGDHTSTLWQVSDASVKPIYRFYGHQHSVKVIACKPDDCYTFATGARDGALLVWDTRIPDHVSEVTDMKPDVYIYFAHEAPSFLKNRKVKSQTNSITGLVFQDDNTLISSSAGNGLIKVWDMRKTYSVYKRLPQPKYVLPYCGNSGRNGYSSLAISPCRLRLYANCIDDKLYCFNIGTYNDKPMAVYSGHVTSSFYIKNCISPDGCYVACGSSDGKAYVWSVSDPSVPLVSLNGHTAEVTSVDWCKTREPKMVTCSDDSTYRIWRVCPQEFDCHDSTLQGFAERCTTDIKPNQSFLKRKYNWHVSKFPRLNMLCESSANSEEGPIDKKPCLNNSSEIPSWTANLPNYVLDGVSPHVNRSGSPKVRDKNWLAKLKKKPADVIDTPQQSSPQQKRSIQKTTCKERNILHYFKVSTRQPVCEQSSSSATESKNLHIPVNISS